MEQNTKKLFSFPFICCIFNLEHFLSRHIDTNKFSHFGFGIGSGFLLSSKQGLRGHLDDIKQFVPEFIPKFAPEYKPDFMSKSRTNSGMNSGTNFFYVV